jgi:hypothetical protein
MKKFSQPKWRIKDFIDLDYFLNQTSEKMSASDSRSPFPSSLSTDRKIYLDYEKTHTPPHNRLYHRRNLIAFWLNEKRKTCRQATEGNLRLPGDIYDETVSLLRNVLIVISLISGVAVAWSALSYSGAAPINIFTCIWILVAPQLLLLVILGISMALGRTGITPRYWPYQTLSSLLVRLFRRAASAGNEKMHENGRRKIDVAVGTIRRNHALYGPIFFWPVFVLAQIFGVFFNVGIFGATLLKLAITDLAFGWQSTLHPSPETVHRLVDLFSMPWSWVPSPHPGIEQIAGSQMILKDGMLHLSTPDLVSWWPFLCFAIFFYGLLPRLILLLTGILRQRTALNRVSFSTGECDRLIQRLRTPQVETAGRAQSTETEKNNNQKQTVRKSPAALSRPANMDLAPATVLIPEEIDECVNDAALADRMARTLGVSIIRRITMDMDPEADAEKLAAAFSAPDRAKSEHRIVILAEAWQPPIRETMAWLEKLSAVVPENTGLIVALIGKPDGREVFTAPGDTDWQVWEEAVTAMGNPFIRVESIGPMTKGPNNE